MKPFLTEPDVEAALQWLHDSADKAAEARANRVYCEEYRKSLKAQLMKEHGLLSAVLQERNAYADPRYEAHLKAIKEAVKEDEKFRFLRASKEATIQAFQTLSANYRGAR